MYTHSQHFFLKFVLVITHCAPKEKYPSTQSLILCEEKKTNTQQKTKPIIELLSPLGYQQICLNIYNHYIHTHCPDMDVKADINHDIT